MASAWHVRRNFRDYGPFTGEQIRKLAVQGKLNAHDFLWNERPEDGAPAGHYEGVSDMIAGGRQRKTSTAVATPPTGTPRPKVSPATKPARKV